MRNNTKVKSGIYAKRNKPKAMIVIGGVCGRSYHVERACNVRLCTYFYNTVLGYNYFNHVISFFFTLLTIFAH